MAARFRRKDESVEAAVRRIACAQIDIGLAALAADEGAGQDAVHQLRQTCKAQRGLIRLVRPGFDGSDETDRLLRDIAGSLSGRAMPP